MDLIILVIGDPDRQREQIDLSVKSRWGIRNLRTLSGQARKRRNDDKRDCDDSNSGRVQSDQRNRPTQRDNTCRVEGSGYLQAKRQSKGGVGPDRGATCSKWTGSEAAASLNLLIRFGDGRKVTLWAEEDLFAVNFSSLLGQDPNLQGPGEANGLPSRQPCAWGSWVTQA